MDVLKGRLKGFQDAFGRKEVREGVLRLLEDKIMQVCERVYYGDGMQGCKVGGAEWATRLDSASAGLTKSGVGRASTQMVADVLTGFMQTITDGEPWVHHPGASKVIMVWWLI
jgi:predicted naringenin-chalcone synthase